jgi:hypothetical protein
VHKKQNPAKKEERIAPTTSLSLCGLPLLPHSPPPRSKDKRDRERKGSKRTHGGFVIPCLLPVLITIAGFSWCSIACVSE